MQASNAAPSILLCTLTFLVQVFSAVPYHYGIPSTCCFSYMRKPVNCELIVDYFEPSSVCSKPAIIFINKIGHPFCADPNAPSVQKCIQKIRTEGVDSSDSSAPGRLMEHASHHEYLRGHASHSLEGCEGMIPNL